jgi:succinate dehydrogenase hydrophobic anchor subunit
MMIRMLATLPAIASALLPETALAGTLVHPLCTAIPGCGSGARNVIIEGAIPVAARVLLNAIAGLSVVFVIVGGARYVLSFGRDDEYAKAKSTIQWALFGLILALASHRIVIMVISEQYLAGGPDPITEFLTAAVRVMTALLNTVFLVVIIGSGMRIVMARGKEEEVSKGRYGVLYAVSGTVIINVAPFVVRSVLQFF